MIQAYITSAHRSYEIADHYRARGIAVATGGLHPTSLPGEAAGHADVVFTGPGDETWPRFLAGPGSPAAPRPGGRMRGALRHAVYAGGWKKFEGVWNLLIRTGQVGRARTALECVLLAAVSRRARREAAGAVPAPPEPAPR